MQKERLKHEARQLYVSGLSHKEICAVLGVSIPKSTMAYWVKGLVLSPQVLACKKQRARYSLAHARIEALESKKRLRNLLESERYERLKPIALNAMQGNQALISLAMLYWAEGKKSATSLCFANSSSKMICVYLNLLKTCYGIDVSKLRFTIQCRADQDPRQLESYWRSIIRDSEVPFYKFQVDSRTQGKPTLKKDYKGVLRIDCFNATIRRDLEMLTELLFKQATVGP